jgi:hypothetical protein
MPFEFIQIPANGQGSAKEELNKLLRGGRIASVKKEFVPNGEDSHTTPAGRNPVGVAWFGAPMTQGSVAPRRNPGLPDAIPSGLNVMNGREIPSGLDLFLLCQRHCVSKPRVGLRHEGLP